MFNEIGGQGSEIEDWLDVVNTLEVLILLFQWINFGGSSTHRR